MATKEADGACVCHRGKAYRSLLLLAELDPAPFGLDPFELISQRLHLRRRPLQAAAVLCRTVRELGHRHPGCLLLLERPLELGTMRPRRLLEAHMVRQIDG